MTDPRRGAGGDGPSSPWATTLRENPAVRPLAVLFVLAGAIPFFTSTTFISDDHLFLAFARDEPRPWRVLFADLHGGEFYRPLPMLVWWALGRLALGFDLGVGAGIFGGLSAALHSAVAAEAGALLATIGAGSAGRVAGASALRPAAFPNRATGAPPEVLAAAVFFLLPMPREAAAWYAASTDLLAAVFGLGAVLALLRDRRWLATALFLLACGSKETAVAFPFLALVAMRAAGAAWRAAFARVWTLGVVLVGYALGRTCVLHGLGGSGDVAAPIGGRLVQIAVGVAQIFSTGAESPSLGTCAVGAGVWVGSMAWLLHDARRSPSPVCASAPRFGWILAWLGFSLAPLLGAPWVVGARYFYLPAIAGAWLVGTVLARRGKLVRVGALALLAGISLARAGARRDDVRAYEARLLAVRRAVEAGLAGGHRTFQVVAGIKDLDLAVKEAPALRERAADFLVLGDVPASFVETVEPDTSSAPHAPELEIDFLLARPPLPPSGAYRFGSHRIVGLARQGDDPTLDEVFGHFPDLRLLRLFPLPEPRSAGDSSKPPRLVARDVTDAWMQERGATDE